MARQHAAVLKDLRQMFIEARRNLASTVVSGTGRPRLRADKLQAETFAAYQDVLEAIDAAIKEEDDLP